MHEFGFKFQAAILRVYSTQYVYSDLLPPPAYSQENTMLSEPVAFV